MSEETDMGHMAIKQLEFGPTSKYKDFKQPPKHGPPREDFRKPNLQSPKELSVGCTTILTVTDSLYIMPSYFFFSLHNFKY